jgi:hypothetical protein
MVPQMNISPLFSFIQRSTRFGTSIKNVTNNVDTSLNFLPHQKKGLAQTDGLPAQLIRLLIESEGDCFGCDDENDRSVGNPKRKV